MVASTQFLDHGLVDMNSSLSRSDRWTSKYCSKARLLLKIDDDVFIRMSKLETLETNIARWTNSPNNLYIGNAYVILFI